MRHPGEKTRSVGVLHAGDPILTTTVPPLRPARSAADARGGGVAELDSAAERAADIHQFCKGVASVPHLPSDADQFPWIDEVEEFLADQDDVEIYDDSEEYEDVYVFFIGEAEVDALLAVASPVATLPDVPEGVVAFVTEDDAEEFGLGRRVALPIG